MFYRVGYTLNNYSFVYDSSDGSCELVQDFELIKSGVNYKDAIDKVYDFNKFRLQYGVSKVLHQMPGVDYMIELVNDAGDNVSVSISLRFLIQKCCNRIVESTMSPTYKSLELSPYLDSHVILLYVSLERCIDLEDGEFIYNYKMIPGNLFHSVSYECETYSNKFTNSLNIPVEMFAYTVSCIKMHDLDGLSRAYNGYLLDKFLVFVDGFGTMKFKSLMGVESWGFMR